MRSDWKAGLLLCAIVAFAGELRAGTCDCNAQTLTVTPGFSVFTPTPQQPTATFTITCNGNATYDMSISPGYSGSFSNRTMLQNGTGPAMNYNIYTDTARTTVWGTSIRRIYVTSSGQTSFTDNLYLDIPSSTQDLPFSGPMYWDQVNVTLTPVLGTGGATKGCQFTIQTSVIAECLTPASTLSFTPNYDPVTANAAVGSPLDATTALLYTCTKNVNAYVQLDQGLHVTGGKRMMLGPQSNLLEYDLFTDLARTVVWSTTFPTNTVSATSTSKSTPLGGPTGLKVYGRIPGAQDVVAGNYSDSVTATVNY